jgi:phenylpropionate dioxygenase-like ring-hydroxylating dioxygenase large terminal subunit
MSTAPSDDPKSFRHYKRWYPDHPELGPPGILKTEPFISDTQFKLERELLWPKVWLMVGRTEWIAKPGQYFVKDIPPSSVSVIVVRDRDGTIRAFHNVCPHRGSQLCFDKSGTMSGFSCPYHGFTYSLDGKLKGVPDEGNFFNLDKEKMGLKPITMDIWAGFIFVHLDPKPSESLRSYLGEIVDGIDDYPFQDSPYCREYTTVINCNWKVLLSGFLEGYHARALHLRSLSRIVGADNPYGHTNFIKLFEKHRMFSFWHNPDVKATKLGEIAYARYAKVLEKRQSAMKPGGDTFKALNSSYYIRNIFPNFQLNLVRGSWFCHQFWPIAVNKTFWHVRLFYPKPLNASEAFFQDYSRYTSRDNLSEDAQASERTQMGLDAGLVDHWVLSDEEIAIHHFNKVVADYTQRQKMPAAAE